MTGLKQLAFAFCLGLLLGFCLSAGYVYKVVSNRIDEELKSIERSIK